MEGYGHYLCWNKELHLLKKTLRAYPGKKIFFAIVQWLMKVRYMALWWIYRVVYNRSKTLSYCYLDTKVTTQDVVIKEANLPSN